MNVKVFVMDVDGTMTDGKIYIGPKGEIAKNFNVKDGYGIHNILPEMGIIPIVLTGRESEIVRVRCQELNIKYVIQGSMDKVKDLELLLQELSLQWNQVAYMGDDLNDLSIMRKAGWTACPSDAANDIKEVSQFVASKEGGAGAVREAIDFLKSHLEVLDER